MDLLTKEQLKQVSAGIFGVDVVMLFEGEHTFANGFWNGVSAVGPGLGYTVGVFASIVMLPLDLLGFVDINSHLSKKNTIAEYPE